MGDQGQTGTAAQMANHPLWVVVRWAAWVVLGWVAAGAWWWPQGWLWLLATHALLYVCWHQAGTVRQQAWVGLAFGVGLHTHGHGWLFDTLWLRAQAPWFWALLGAALVVLYLALYSAAAAALAGVWSRRASPTPVARAGVFALCFTVAECLRGLPWNGMTGLSVGYALLDTPVMGWLPVLGLYGASAGGVWCAAACGAWVRAPRSLAMALGVLWVVGIVWGVGALLRQQPWVEPAPGQPRWTYHLLVAPAAPLAAQPATPAAWLDRLETTDARLVLTPESAVPVPFAQWPSEWATRLQRHSARTGGHLFVGTLAEAPGGGLNNAVLRFAPHGSVGRYNKRALTPVGEYTPWGWAWFTGALRIPYRDLQAGGAQPPLWVGGPHGGHGGPGSGVAPPAVPVGLLVCHEDMTSGWAVAGAPMAGVWLNPSNLAWFDDPRARQLRLQAARARAAETGRPVLRAEAAGHTVHIDHQGRVVAQAPPGGDLQGVVEPQTGLTPFVRWARWVGVFEKY